MRNPTLLFKKRKSIGRESGSSLDTSRTSSDIDAVMEKMERIEERIQEEESILKSSSKKKFKRHDSDNQSCHDDSPPKKSIKNVEKRCTPEKKRSSHKNRSPKKSEEKRHSTPHQSGEKKSDRRSDCKQSDRKQRLITPVRYDLSVEQQNDESQIAVVKYSSSPSNSSKSSKDTSSPSKSSSKEASVTILNPGQSIAMDLASILDDTDAKLDGLKKEESKLRKKFKQICKADIAERITWERLFKNQALFNLWREKTIMEKMLKQYEVVTIDREIEREKLEMQINSVQQELQEEQEKNPILEGILAEELERREMLLLKIKNEDLESNDTIIRLQDLGHHVVGVTKYYDDFVAKNTSLIPQNVPQNKNTAPFPLPDEDGTENGTSPAAKRIPMSSTNSVEIMLNALENSPSKSPAKSSNSVTRKSRSTASPKKLKQSSSKLMDGVSHAVENRREENSNEDTIEQRVDRVLPQKLTFRDLVSLKSDFKRMSDAVDAIHRKRHTILRGDDKSAEDSSEDSVRYVHASEQRGYEKQQAPEQDLVDDLVQYVEQQCDEEEQVDSSLTYDEVEQYEIQQEIQYVEQQICEGQVQEVVEFHDAQQREECQESQDESLWRRQLEFPDDQSEQQYVDGNVEIPMEMTPQSEVTTLPQTDQHYGHGGHDDHAQYMDSRYTKDESHYNSGLTCGPCSRLTTNEWHAGDRHHVLEELLNLHQTDLNARFAQADGDTEIKFDFTSTDNSKVNQQHLRQESHRKQLRKEEHSLNENSVSISEEKYEYDIFQHIRVVDPAADPASGGEEKALSFRKQVCFSTSSSNGGSSRNYHDGSSRSGGNQYQNGHQHQQGDQYDSSRSSQNTSSNADYRKDTITSNGLHCGERASPIIESRIESQYSNIDILQRNKKIAKILRGEEQPNCDKIGSPIKIVQRRITTKSLEETEENGKFGKPVSSQKSKSPKRAKPLKGADSYGHRDPIIQTGSGVNHLQGHQSVPIPMLKNYPPPVVNNYIAAQHNVSRHSYHVPPMTTANSYGHQSVQLTNSEPGPGVVIHHTSDQISHGSTQVNIGDNQSNSYVSQPVANGYIVQQQQQQPSDVVIPPQTQVQKRKFSYSRSPQPEKTSCMPQQNTSPMQRSFQMKSSLREGIGSQSLGGSAQFGVQKDDHQKDNYYAQQMELKKRYQLQQQQQNKLKNQRILQQPLQTPQIGPRLSGTVTPIMHQVTPGPQFGSQQVVARARGQSGIVTPQMQFRVSQGPVVHSVVSHKQNQYVVQQQHTMQPQQNVNQQQVVQQTSQVQHQFVQQHECQQSSSQKKSKHKYVKEQMRQTEEVIRKEQEKALKEQKEHDEQFMMNPNEKSPLQKMQCQFDEIKSHYPVSTNVSSQVTSAVPTVRQQMENARNSMGGLPSGNHVNFLLVGGQKKVAGTRAR